MPKGFWLSMLVSNLLSLICGAGAVILLIEGKEGWGWLLTVSAIASTNITFSKGNKENSDDRNLP